MVDGALPVGGVACQEPERGFDFGAPVEAVDAQGHRQGPGQREEASLSPVRSPETTANPAALVKAGQNGVMAIALTPNQREAITEACRRHQVARLHAFGSVVGSHYQPGVSDIDLLVEFKPCDPGALYKSYFSLLNELCQQLPAPVDLVMADAVRNPYVKASIEADKQILYAA